MKMLLVEFVDSRIGHGWMQKDEAFTETLPLCKIIGFKCSENAESLTLVMGISDSGMMIECFSIPQGCIKSIRELRVK